MMFIDADILEGSSGSMVIDVMGRVVGSVMGIIGRHAADVGSGQNAVVTVDKIKRVLDVVLSGG
jgi:S1-C subfamily serine protease